MCILSPKISDAPSLTPLEADGQRRYANLTEKLNCWKLRLLRVVPLLEHCCRGISFRGARTLLTTIFYYSRFGFGGVKFVFGGAPPTLAPRCCGLPRRQRPFLVCVVFRRVARIWKRGGLFWKSEKCANDLDSNFHWPWISFRRFVRNLRRNISERLEFQRFFPPKIRWSPKKRSSPKFRAIFLPISQVQTYEGGLFSYGGGLFSIFHRKSASKAQKTCDFAFFTSQWGGSSPPRPPWLRYWLYCNSLFWMKTLTWLKRE